MKAYTLLVHVSAGLSFVAIVGACNINPNCPTCGTIQNGTMGVIDVIPVPEHNPTGEPGGPFNSFDDSWVDTPHHRDYVSDRVGLDVVVIDTQTDLAVNAIGGDNAVSDAQMPSPCDPSIPPNRLDVMNEVELFGCRMDGNFGGFLGAQCCGARGNIVNPLSSPDGMTVTPDGKTLFVSNSDSAVVVFDLTTNPPGVLADIPTGQSPTWNGPYGVSPCIASASGLGFSSPNCGDLRADEQAYDPVDQILAVMNGDPGNPFVTIIDVSGVVNRTSHCLPVKPKDAYSYANPPTCVLGQIYFDGVPDDPNKFINDMCPDPSTTMANGMPSPTGIVGPHVACHHGPIAPAGLGGFAWNPATGHFLMANPNNAANPALGEVTDIDPKNPNGPQIVHHFPIMNCQAGSIVQGPSTGQDFLVGCADHDGEQFPPNEIIINGTTGAIEANIPYVGGVDEIWFNPGDNRYYVAARDMPNGPVLGVIDAIGRQWLQNVPTNTNSHSVAADASNNRVFVPSQAGGLCGTQSADGCILVYGAL
jgi:YVTN family beta-propeller protein